MRDVRTIQIQQQMGITFLNPIYLLFGASLSLLRTEQLWNQNETEKALKHTQTVH